MRLAGVVRWKESSSDVAAEFSRAACRTLREGGAPSHWKEPVNGEMADEDAPWMPCRGVFRRVHLEGFPRGRTTTHCGIMYPIWPGMALGSPRRGGAGGRTRGEGHLGYFASLLLCHHDPNKQQKPDWTFISSCRCSQALRGALWESGLCMDPPDLWTSSESKSNCHF